MARPVTRFGSLRRHLVSAPLELIMGGCALAALVSGDSRILLIAGFTTLISFLPIAVEKILHVRLPSYVHFLFVLFVFLSMFSGEVLGMYGHFYPWDDIMHFASGVLVGLGAVLWVTHLSRNTATLPPWLQVVFVFLVAATVAVLWEFAEFGSDSLFGTFTQRNDLRDTMTDLLYGSLGGGVFAVLLARYLSGKGSFGVQRIVSRFLQLNEKNSK